MRGALARWLFGKMVERQIIGFIWLGGFGADPGSILPPHEVEVLFRGR